jgi:poly(ADP-ribose) glycohydrolase ARH3
MNRKEIMFAVGVHGLREFTAGLTKSLMPDYKPGAVLADTLMAQELALSLTAGKGKLDAEDLKQRFCRLLDCQEFLESAPGAHCLLPLRRLVDGAEPDEGSQDTTHVNAAARAYPVGCLPDQSSIINIAVEQAKLSQSDKRVWAAAAVLADSIGRFVRGQKITTGDEVKSYVQAELDNANKIDERFAESWDDVAPDLDYMTPAEELPYSLINVDSHVNECVPTAVGIFLIFRHNFEEAVAAAASAGGDTDTVAAIVGALSGAYHGLSAIPERWLKQISHREALENVARGLIELWN